MSVTTPARRYEDNEPPDAENTNNINDQDLHDKSFDDDFYAEMTNGKRRCLDGSSTGDDTCRGISDLGRAMQDDDDDDLHDFEDDWDSDPYEWESEQEVYKVVLWASRRPTLKQQQLGKDENDAVLSGHFNIGNFRPIRLRNMLSRCEIENWSFTLVARNRIWAVANLTWLFTR
ncbi:hypothetical protein FOZ62_030467 [Perkinsus olseni]|uniref:Uncharacterized protein n=1 Tax=Perkinsus olseni TaxID=32597 RepID=A0A7J6UEL2_PEROL|nr:hypothetical protein FOZ62_030467 [Perkinsus olseni]